jgi:2-polyprenyl-3-methyl-5-hydroxy-6-metoxy-1,4-benzoquinol methylase
MLETLSKSNEPDGFNRSYVGRRKDLLALVAGKPARVLEIGCALGATGGYLKEQHGCTVVGVEIDARMAEVARGHLDQVLVGDLNRSSLTDLVGDQRFDLIFFGDVLEHLIDPWSTLAAARSLLTAEGRIVASLPNINHVTTLASLIFLRRWPYRDRGLHDRTHLRFFTRKNLVELYESAGLEIEAESRNLRIIDPVASVNVVAKLFDFPPFRSYFTYQYLHRLRAR